MSLLDSSSGAGIIKPILEYFSLAKFLNPLHFSLYSIVFIYAYWNTDDLCLCNFILQKPIGIISLLDEAW